MRIDARGRIAGLASIAVRAFLRSAGDADWDVDYAASRFRVTRRRAQRVIQRLVALGYVQETSVKGDRSFKRTLAGSALAQASAAPPLRRATADRKLSEFLARVRQINGDDYYLYRVKRAVVFGSYLTDAERINDIDVAIELAPRWRDPEKHETLSESRVERAKIEGRRFGNIVHEVTWPQTEIWLALKARSRAISLHPTDDAILQRADTKIIFNSQ